MCGLTGFVRHPQGVGLPVAQHVFDDLMVAMEHRGRHATGIAACGGSKPFTWKRAVTASTVVGSDVWKGLLRGMSGNTPVLLGHVRYATQPNGGEDAAAHPFTFGQVVGAHNGIIHNWRELEKKHPTREKLKVDSEIAFHLLNEFDDPADALNLLDGYWALTWFKKGKFYVCRTNDAPLSMAYSPRMQTLFWNSEQSLLRKALRDRGVDDVEVWEINSGSVYEYTPSHFSKQGTNVKRREVKFENRKTTKMTRQAQLALGTGGSGRQWEERRSEPSASVLADLWGEISRMKGQIQELQNEVDRQGAEIDYLYEVLNAEGIMDGTPEEEICVECKSFGDNMLELPGGGKIHEACIFGKTEKQRVRV